MPSPPGPLSTQRPAVFDPIPLTPFPTVEKGGFEIIAIMLFQNFFATVRLRVRSGDILSYLIRTVYY
jgi:hypothetical protein